MSDKESGEVAGGSWWGSLVAVAKEKTEKVFEVVSKDLSEFTATMQHDAKKVVEKTKETLSTVGTEDSEKNTTDRMKQSFHNFMQGITKALTVEPEDTSAPKTSVLQPEPVTFNRAKARLRAIQMDTGTYLNKPSGPVEQYADWLRTFQMEQHKGEISQLVVTMVEVRSLYTTLVPSEVSHQDFWCRYFYKVHQLLVDEERKQALMKRAEHAHIKEDTLGWDEEESSITDNESISTSTKSELATHLESHMKSTTEKTTENPEKVMDTVKRIEPDKEVDTVTRIEPDKFDSTLKRTEQVELKAETNSMVNETLNLNVNNFLSDLGDLSHTDNSSEPHSVKASQQTGGANTNITDTCLVNESFTDFKISDKEYVVITENASNVSKPFEQNDDTHRGQNMCKVSPTVISEATGKKQPDIVTVQNTSRDNKNICDKKESSDCKEGQIKSDAFLDGIGEPTKGKEGNIDEIMEATLAELKTKVKGDMVVVGERISPSSESSGNKESNNGDWEQDFDVDITPEDLVAANELAHKMNMSAAEYNKLTGGDDDWESWE